MAVVVLLILLALIVWAALFVNKKPDISPTIRSVINFILAVLAIALLLYAFGLWDEVKNTQVPKIK